MPFRKTDRKSTRLNSSHTVISYAVFCLKKKKDFDQAIEAIMIAKESVEAFTEKLTDLETQVPIDTIELVSSNEKSPKYPFFFFNDTPTTEIYTLSLHDALPICSADPSARSRPSRHCRRARPASRQCRD